MRLIVLLAAIMLAATSCAGGDDRTDVYSAPTAALEKRARKHAPKWLEEYVFLREAGEGFFPHSLHAKLWPVSSITQVTTWQRYRLGKEW